MRSRAKTLLITIAIVAAAAAVAIYYATRGTARVPGAVSSSELRWTSEYGRWVRTGACRPLSRAPTRRFAVVRAMALHACDTGAPPTAATRRILGLLVFERRLPRSSAPTDASRIDPSLSRAAEPIARGPVQVRCWSKRDWGEATKEWQALTGRSRVDSYVDAFADPLNRRIHLSPGVCPVLDRFFARHDTHGDVADALVALAHEAEHVRDSLASETAVQCAAIRDVRRIVRRAGAHVDVHAAKRCS